MEPRPEKAIIIIVQVEGSGADAVKGSISPVNWPDPVNVSLRDKGVGVEGI